jgi:glutamyl/glutaminyl-tRNA synthetase
MNKVVKLKDWLHDLCTNSKGVIKIDEPKLLMKSIEEYQENVLHELSTGIVRQNTIKSLLNTTRKIHELRNVEFEDETVPEILLQIFRANLETLGKLSEDMRKELEKELTNKAISQGDNKEIYEAMLNDKLNGLVEEYGNKERQRIEKIAEDDVRAISLGIPKSAIHRDFRTPEEKLRDILVSIKNEQQSLERQRLEDLSLFEQTKTLAEYKSRKQQDLEKTLNAVSECMIRNNPRERLISQKYKPKKEVD